MAPKTTAKTSLTADPRAFRTCLRRWFLEHRRDLPWRRHRTPYAVIVSECMLQQTQVATVMPYFERWIQRFPDLPTLAAARESEVLKAWEGLGYYSRARRLHALAQKLAPLPTLPREPASWLALPGIGPYTAAAVCSLAFGQPCAVVDGNVARILSRLMADTREFRDGSQAARLFAPLAQSLLDPAHPGDHNEAMMELGATLCTPRKPQCLLCPVRAFCAGLRTGQAESLPRLAPKKQVARALTRAWVYGKEGLLLRRADAGQVRLAGLCELPETADLPASCPPQGIVATKRRAISSERLVETIVAVRPDRKLLGHVRQSQTLFFAKPQELEGLTLSGPHRRWIAELLARGTASR